MWEDENTVTYYKTFISALLQQLNDAIEQGDFDAKYECLAVINDLEQMFEKFRVEKLIDESLEESRLVEQQHQKKKKKKLNYRDNSNMRMMMMMYILIQNRISLVLRMILLQKIHFLNILLFHPYHHKYQWFVQLLVIKIMTQFPIIKVQSLTNYHI